MRGIVKTGLLSGGRGAHSILVVKDFIGIQSWVCLLLWALRVVTGSFNTVSRRLEECHNSVPHLHMKGFIRIVRLTKYQDIEIGLDDSFL